MLKLSSVILMDFTEKIIAVLVAFSVIMSVAVTVLDKFFARHRMRRISERTLLVVGVFCSTVAMYVTMRIIRHKTRHNKFMYGLPLVILLKFAFLAFAYIFMR